MFFFESPTEDLEANKTLITDETLITSKINITAIELV